MILTYRHIAKLIDLLEDEIRRVESHRDGFNISAVPISEELDSPLRNAYNESKEKYEKELALVKECLDGLSAEVNKINFLFGVKEEHKNV